MSLSVRLKGAVDTAFSAAGTLARDGLLSTKAVTDYDFNACDVTSSTTTKTVKVIIFTETHPTTGAIILKALTKSGVDLGGYDTIKVDNVDYNITDTVDDGFTINLNIVREVT